jgi:hypothetical protein
LLINKELLNLKKRHLRWNQMLFYMQMRNWFLVFLMLTIVYLVQHKTSVHNHLAMRAQTQLLTLMR